MGSLNEAATLRYLKDLPELPVDATDDRWLMVFFAAVILALVTIYGLWFYAMVQADNRWAAFAPVHHCKLVGTKEGSYSTGLAANAKMVMVYNSGTNSFLCDDGITYERPK